MPYEAKNVGMCVPNQAKLSKCHNVHNKCQRLGQIMNWPK